METTVDKPKKKVNGKQKGNSFERVCANLLSKRFEECTGVEKSFRRNSDSGSFFGGSNKSRVATHNTETAAFGDLICPASFKFSVECKHYKTPPTFSSVMNSQVPQWDGWIAQSDQDSAMSGRTPLLIVKYNNVEVLAFVRESFPSLQLRHVYKDRNVYLLNDLLTLPDNVFFDTP